MRNKVLILGNGPSLPKDLENVKSDLEEFDVLSVNGFVNSGLYEVLKPRFHILADSDFWREDTYENFKRLRETIFTNILQKTKWEMYLLLPIGAIQNKLFQKLFDSNPNIKIQYYNNTIISGSSKFVIWAISKKLGLPKPTNILIPSIVNSIHLGYNEIYLAGVDHTWPLYLFVDKKNEVYYKNNYFYEEGMQLAQAYNSSLGQYYKIHELFDSFYHTFHAYHIIRHFANLNNIQIINLTEESLIDAFERKGN